MNAIHELKTILGEQAVLTEAVDKAYAGLDKSTNIKESLPLAVVKVTTVSQLILSVQCCLRHKKPLVIRAQGTGKSGGAIGFADSIVIDTARLNRIISIDRSDMIATVEPGVVLHDLQTAVSKLGLFYPPDPASFRMCTIGGNVAENASGPSTIKYGSTRDYLLGGQAILGTGEVIDFGKRCPKGVAGYDIASLLCGSEGTLAVFTQFILRLLPAPKSRALAWFFFDTEEAALRAIKSLFAVGHLPKTLEYVDRHCLMALKDFSGFSIKPEVKAALIIECDASFKEGALLSLNAIKKTLLSFSVIHTLFAFSVDEQDELWRMRSLLSEACSAYLGQKVSEDIAVPLGKLGALAMVAKALDEPPHFLCGLFGHAGDGNLHVQFMFDDESLRERAEQCRHAILLEVLRLGGTLSAEHGIGLSKKAYLPLEQSQSLIKLQKRVKKAFDPHNLLNPGKIFDV